MTLLRVKFSRPFTAETSEKIGRFVRRSVLGDSGGLRIQCGIEDSGIQLDWCINHTFRSLWIILFGTQNNKVSWGVYTEVSTSGDTWKILWRHGVLYCRPRMAGRPRCSNLSVREFRINVRTQLVQTIFNYLSL